MKRRFVLLACMLLGTTGLSACANTTPPAPENESDFATPTPAPVTPVPTAEQTPIPVDAVPASPTASPDALDPVADISDDEVMEMMDSLWGGGGASGDDDPDTEATPTVTPTPEANPELLLEDDRAATPTPTETPEATATPTAEADEAEEATPTPEATTADDEEESQTTTNSYRNGFYTVTGGYRSPAGNEIIEVELALDDDVITNVNIIPQARHDTSLRHQRLFADGIGLEVIGLELDEVEEFASVNGSSLTPGGFDRALVKIREEARR